MDGNHGWHIKAVLADADNVPSKTLTWSLSCFNLSWKALSWTQDGEPRQNSIPFILYCVSWDGEASDSMPRNLLSVLLTSISQTHSITFRVIEARFLHLIDCCYFFGWETHILYVRCERSICASCLIIMLHLDDNERGNIKADSIRRVFVIISQ